MSMELRGRAWGLAGVMLILLGNDAARAAVTQPKKLGDYQSWAAYTMTDGKGPICYLVGTPKAQEPAKLKRDAHLLVTHRPTDKAFNVVSVEPGPNFAFAKGSSVTVTIDKQSFDFFTANDTAWSRDSDTDKAVVSAMAKGKELIIKAKPLKGADISDIYALGGLGEALGAIDKACKVKR